MDCSGKKRRSDASLYSFNLLPLASSGIIVFISMEEYSPERVLQNPLHKE